VQFTKYFYDKIFETRSVGTERNDYDLCKTLTKIKIFFLFINFSHLSLTAEQKLTEWGCHTTSWQNEDATQQMRMPHNKLTGWGCHTTNWQNEDATQQIDRMRMPHNKLTEW